MLTRRQWFSGLVAAAVAFVTVRRVVRYGFLDVQMWHRGGFARRGATVYLDGRDITNDCVRCHDGEGWADVLLRNAEGHRYLNQRLDGLATRRLTGQVEVRIP